MMSSPKESLSAPPPATGPARCVLRVLATSDLHGHILPWDDLSDQPAPDRGLAALASLIAAARAEVPGSLLLDNGDFLNGSPLSDHVAETHGVRGAACHPMIAAMNRLGYDAATLGNHEFSNGLDLLGHALAQAEFPLIATNLDRLAASGGRKRAFAPRHALVRRTLHDAAGARHCVTIGILGFLPPQTIQWERRHLAGRVAARGILSAARAALPRLRRAGADLVIALSHSGLGGEARNEEAENISCALAALEGIDAVIAGHTHQVFPNPANDSALSPAEPRLGPSKPMVMPGFYGSHLGVIDLTLAQDGAGWRVAAHEVSLRPVSRRVGSSGRVEPLAAVDPDVAAVSAQDTAAMRRRAAEPAGETAIPLHSYFALIGHSPVQSLLAEAQAHNMHDLLQGHPEAGLPMLVSVAPFKAGGRGGPANYTDIPCGHLTARNIADLYIHPNSPVALRVTGADLAMWLERSVSLFRQILPGARDACLINPDFPAYNFEMIHGLTYRVDLSQPARFDCLGQIARPGATRICGLSFNGRPIDPTQTFVLVTNSYRASGGAGFAATDPPDVVMEESRPLRRILRDHIVRQGRIAPHSRPGWGFCPMPGTTVVFDTGPGAAAHASAIDGLEPVGLQPTGFLRFRLSL